MKNLKRAKRTGHNDVEVLFFQLFRVMNNRAGTLIRQRYDRIEQAYSKYVLALNSSDENLQWRRSILLKQMRELTDLIHKESQFISQDFDNTPISQHNL